MESKEVIASLEQRRKNLMSVLDTIGAKSSKQLDEIDFIINAINERDELVKSMDEFNKYVAENSSPWGVDSIEEFKEEFEDE